jgi:hypothetical protein
MIQWCRSRVVQHLHFSFFHQQRWWCRLAGLAHSFQASTKLIGYLLTPCWIWQDRFAWPNLLCWLLWTTINHMPFCNLQYQCGSYSGQALEGLKLRWSFGFKRCVRTLVQVILYCLWIKCAGCMAWRSTFPIDVEEFLKYQVCSSRVCLLSL